MSSHNSREISSDEIRNMKKNLSACQNKNCNHTDCLHVENNFRYNRTDPDPNGLSPPITNIYERDVNDEVCFKHFDNDKSRCRYSFYKNFTNKNDDLSTVELLMRTYQQQKTVAEDDFVFNYGSRKILQNMYKMWLHQVMCDLNIITKGGDILTHQVLISAFSPSLSKLFCQKTTQRIATINLSTISREIVADVLNFLYTADIQLSCRIIDDVVFCADELDLEVVKVVCSDFLTTSLNEENIILHYCLAYNNKLEKAITMCTDFIAKNFEQTKKHPYFVLLSPEQLENILKHKDIICDTDNVLEVLASWVDYNVPMRISHVEYLFLFIPPHQINVEKIKSTINKKQSASVIIGETKDEIQEISDKMNKSHPDDWKLIFGKKNSSKTETEKHGSDVIEKLKKEENFGGLCK
ncbi:hypothetical protein HELRODRAFT_167644 [Helobdella robusta]|uniref:BTB domain-containing protein n=1 Tax=Helobdella robusta TaxID=6412 RepID=T1EZL8_HELRO|nr:hypothetical protein HELRODRAFT_167644 [Helobdella robusta]ESO09834.1 hypothetical protein HELRODRAFT_167644 [Helobdella robusta]